MADAAHPEPKEAHGKEEKKEAQKPVVSLENVVRESWHAIRKGAKLGLAAALPVGLSYMFPQAAIDIGTWTAAVIAGDATVNYMKGKKHTMDEILKSSIIGTATAMPLHYIFNAINTIPLTSAAGYIGMAAAFGGIAYPLFVGLYQGVDYLVRNRTFKGMGKYLKENYMPALKKAWKVILPFSLANLYLVPRKFQVAVGSALSYFFTLFGAPKKEELKEEEKKDKQPYYSAMSNVARNVFYTPSRVANYVGSFFRDAYKSLPGPKGVAKPAAAPSEGHEGHAPAHT